MPMLRAGKVILRTGSPTNVRPTLPSSTKDYLPQRARSVLPFGRGPMFAARYNKAVLLSSIGTSLWAAAILYSVKTFGLLTVLRVWGLPHIWFNHWLIIVTFLNHMDPALPHWDVSFRCPPLLLTVLLTIRDHEALGLYLRSRRALHFRSRSDGRSGSDRQTHELGLLYRHARTGRDSSRAPHLSSNTPL